MKHSSHKPLILLVVFFSLLTTSFSCDDDEQAPCAGETIDLRILNTTRFTIDEIDLFGIEIDSLNLAPFELSAGRSFMAFADTGYYDLAVRLAEGGENDGSILDFHMMGVEEVCGNEEGLPIDLSGGCYLLVLDRIDTDNVFCSNSLYAYWVREE